MRERLIRVCPMSVKTPVFRMLRAGSNDWRRCDLIGRAHSAKDCACAGSGRMRFRACGRCERGGGDMRRRMPIILKMPH